MWRSVTVLALYCGFIVCIREWHANININDEPSDICSHDDIQLLTIAAAATVLNMRLRL